MEEVESYEVSRLNRVNRMPARAKYDYKTVHAIFRAARTVHLAFVDPDGLPQCVPMVGALDESEEGLFVILHGYHGARFMRMTSEKGVPLCVTATLQDGLVLALAAFHHSNNYRAATLHGFSDPIDEDDLKTKRRCAELVVEAVMPGRWKACRQPTDSELQSTGFLRMRIESGSAKVRTGGPKDDKADLQDADLLKHVWTGVVPSETRFTSPIPTAENRIDPAPLYILSILNKPL